MNLPMYCTVCDALTGHDVLSWKCKCVKCGRERGAPIKRWLAGILLVLGLAAFGIWFTFISVLSILQWLNIV